MKHPITISGGGLTGLSLAIGLRRAGVEVDLHEAGSYPRHRVCGEFISGVSPEVLERIGIADCLEDAGHRRSFTWHRGDRAMRHGRLPRPALAISRHRLDDRLHERAKHMGANIQTSSRMADRQDEPGFVKASGRIPTRGPWIGLKAHVRGLNPSAELEMHTGPHGYLGITEVEEGWFNVCGLFRNDRRLEARRENLLIEHVRRNGSHALARSLQQASWREGSFCAVAGFELGNQERQDGVLCLGDSHSIIPPFTGNGMSMAFESVDLALPHLVAHAAGELEWPQAVGRIERALDKAFRTRLAASRCIHPVLFCSGSRLLFRHLPLKPLLKLIR
ncbi:MAG: FAD-dependent monooxygenase [Akkermansiaceae bacterium]|nr:FAD-dependent monooxygenase [Akkermansiaceae bacterium]